MASTKKQGRGDGRILLLRTARGELDMAIRKRLEFDGHEVVTDSPNRPFLGWTEPVAVICVVRTLDDEVNFSDVIIGDPFRDSTSKIVVGARTDLKWLKWTRISTTEKTAERVAIEVLGSITQPGAKSRGVEPPTHEEAQSLLRRAYGAVLARRLAPDALIQLDLDELRAESAESSSGASRRDQDGPPALWLSWATATLARGPARDVDEP